MTRRLVLNTLYALICLHVYIFAPVCLWKIGVTGRWHPWTQMLAVLFVAMHITSLLQGRELGLREAYNGSPPPPPGEAPGEEPAP